MGALLNVTFPFLIAAIDPKQEAKLAHLDAAVIGGRYLRGADQPSRVATGGGASDLQVPVLAASGPLVDDTDLVTVRRQDPARAAQMAAGLTPAQATALVAGGGGGVLVSHVQVGARAAYQNLLASLRGISHSFVDNYWTAGPTRYRQQGGSL